MVTDLCQALGSASPVCLWCEFRLGRQDGDRFFVSGAWVGQPFVFVCVSIRKTRW